MKTLVPFFILMMMVSLACAQEQQQNKKPDEQIKVDKEYDENGNLIRYDSTYVWSWSSDTAMTGMDMEEMRKEMENFFGSGFHGMMPDSSILGDDPFHDLQERFFPDGTHMFHHFDWGNSDSTMLFLPDSLNSFQNFEKLREELMNHFGQYFQNDSTPMHLKGMPDQKEFDFFFDPGDIEKLQKEFEKQFEQLRPGDEKPQKLGT